MRDEARTGTGVSEFSDRSGWKHGHWTVRDTVVIVAEVAPEVPVTGYFCLRNQQRFRRQR